MSFVSVGDMMGSFRLQHRSLEIREKLDELGFELASGQKEDVAKSVSGDLRPLSSLKRVLTLNEVFKQNAHEASLMASGLQDTLNILELVATQSVQIVLAAKVSESEAQITASSKDASQKLEMVMGALNVKIAGRSIFAGQDSDGPAMAASETLLSMLDAALSGASTATAGLAAIDSFFDDPGGGFETSIFLGSAQTFGEQKLSETESVAFVPTALDENIRNTIKGLATAALLSRGFLEDAGAERSELLTASGEKLLAAAGGIVELQADIGRAQERIEMSQSQNSAQRSALQIALAAITTADPYETATKFQAVEGQLEALYTVTAKLSNLSLTGFLR